MAYADPDTQREYQRLWRQGRIECLRATRRWKAKNRVKVNAANHRYRKDRGRTAHRACKKAQFALRRGVLIRPNECEICYRPVKLHMHHQDYSRPLEVNWLCIACHVRVHNAVRELARMAS